MGVFQEKSQRAFNEWFGFYLPAKATPEVVQRANAALRTALAEREVIEQGAQGVVGQGGLRGWLSRGVAVKRGDRIVRSPAG